MTEADIEENSDTDWTCGCCGKDCSIDNKDYYMLQEDLWMKLNGKDDGMLCMDCVENKLGRKLSGEDILPSFLTLFRNDYTKNIMKTFGYKFELDDYFTFALNVFEEEVERIYQFYHTKRLYKFFEEMSKCLETCRIMIKEKDGYESSEFCICPECTFEEIIMLSNHYSIGRTINKGEIKWE